MKRFDSSITDLPRLTGIACLAVLLCTAWSGRAHGESQQELLFFLSVEGFQNLSGSNPAVEDSYVLPTADVLYSFSSDSFRLLGEYVWSSEESELERLQAGWQAGENTMLWLGRFHVPGMYWTSEYHHGRFLQTSISRPGVEEWEDESGPIPSHITGLLLETDVARSDNSAIHVALSGGLAPKFIGEELHPFDLLDPESGHGLGFNARLAFRPDVFGDNQLGLLGTWNDIEVVSESNPALQDLQDIRQITVGAYVDWRWDKWRLISSFVHFDNDLRSLQGSTSETFQVMYAQGEYELNSDWTIFGRTENGFGEDQSEYLRLLPAFIAHRNMLGARWDFADFQSLTLEVASTSAQGEDFSHDNFSEIRLQWSGVFP